MRFGAAPVIALIVEDEALIALMLNELLLAEGFETVVVADEQAAQEQVARNFALAVVDISLANDIAGQRVIASLRSQSPDLPVVVVTGYSYDAEQADLRGLGGPTIRLHKPAYLDQLATAVWEVIDPAYLAERLARRQRRGDRS